MAQHVLVPVAIGELYDKVTILEIKLERIDDPAKLANVRTELELLNRVVADQPDSQSAEVLSLRAELKRINEAIWDAENLVRQVASRDGFGLTFAEVAKYTYQNNDRRAEVKRRLSILGGSSILEEKSHATKPVD